MNTKTCSKCGAKKDVSEFGKRKANISGFSCWCKECFCKQSKQWLKNNTEKNKQSSKQWYNNNPEYFKQWRKNNPEKVKQIQNKYLKNNPDKRKEIIKKSRLKHKDKINSYMKQYNKIYHKDLNHKLIKLCRARQYKVLKGYSKSAHTEELNGCSNKFFKTYLTNRFYQEYPGLTLYLPACHMHHIIELHTFNMSDPEQQRKAFHYTNVRLMPIEEHRNLHRGIAV